ncbi:MAG: C-GCAxxG-C-C family protein [Candidatus Aminicenantaceae bacterium]
MNRADLAVQCFKGTFNCAQCVFSVFAPKLGLKRRIALKIATPFGGGMAHMDEVCGAVTGGLMVIGLKHGMSKEEDLEAKEKAYKLSQEFASRFKKRNKTIKCRELIGHDLSTPEGYDSAKENNVFDTQCTKFVRDAVEILEEFFV